MSATDPRSRLVGKYALPGISAVIGIILFATTVPRPTTAATLTVTGYVKNFCVVQDPPSIGVATGASRETKYTPNSLVANNVRARVNVAVDVNQWLAVDGAYNLVPRFQNDEAAAFGAALARQVTPLYRIDDLRSSLWPVRPDAADNSVILQNLDRLLVSAAAPWFDIYLGRQAIAWGSAKSVNPTDVIAPYLYTEIDTEHRVGVDAVRLRAPVGALGELDLGYVAGGDGAWDHSAAYMRGKGYGAGVDYSVIAMVFRENALIGADVTFPVKGAGAWIEAAGVFMKEEGKELIDSSADDYARLTAGLDYSFHNATYTFLEYHYNGAGEHNPDHYAHATTNRAYTEGGVYLLGRHYLIPGAAYPLTLLWNLGGSMLVNLDDGSFLLAPTVEYNVRENVYLSAGAFVGFGDRARVTTSITAPPLPEAALLDPSALQLGSEFGAYNDVYFVSARYYF